MKFKIIALLALATLAAGFKAIDDDCLKSIRTGKFSYSGGQDYIIFRSENEQTDTFNNGESIVVSELSWLNEKEYLLTIKKKINCPVSEFSEPGTKMKVRILECSNTFYTCEIEYGKGKKHKAKYYLITGI